MKERPILFNGEMVRAILEGRKTQTRRPIVPQPTQIDGDWYLKLNRKVIGMPNQRAIIPEALSILDACPFGQPGDRLWVRETFSLCGYFSDENIIYRASGEMADYMRFDGIRWTPSIHMPRWASRITLEVTGVRVERVQDISNNDALSEAATDYRTPENNWEMRDCFKLGWNAIYHRKGQGWDANPWVWTVEFKRL